jgi:hypothetical protein
MAADQELDRRSGIPIPTGNPHPTKVPWAKDLVERNDKGVAGVALELVGDPTEVGDDVLQAAPVHLEAREARWVTPKEPEATNP